MNTIGQPALMALFVAVFGIEVRSGRKRLFCARFRRRRSPTARLRYHVYETEAASTLVLTTLTMIVTLPLIIVLIGVHLNELISLTQCLL